MTVDTLLEPNVQIPGGVVQNMVRRNTLPMLGDMEGSIFEAGFTPKVINISSYELNDSEISLLAKGRKFCPTPLYNDLLGLKVDIIEFARKLQLKELFGSNHSAGNGDNLNMSILKKTGTFIPSDDKESFLYKCVYDMKKLANELTDFKVEPPTSNISSRERMAMTRLSKNRNLTIKSADKGGGIVVMDSAFYKKKVEDHLNDATTYDRLVRHKKLPY